MLLPLLVIACIGYLIHGIIAFRREDRTNAAGDDHVLHPCVKYLFAGAVPVGVTISMVYLFMIVGGATTVQFNAGSSSRMDAWSTWVDLWPAFLLLTAISSLAGLIWLVTCACSKKFRSLWPVATWCLLLSGFAFLAVASYFPTA